MSLFPGSPSTVDGKKVLDDAAVANSMALEIENALKDMHQQVKDKPLPDDSKEDLRLLFVSISRGILKYLNDHQGVITAKAEDIDRTLDVDQVNLNVTMNSFTPE
jgi:hypothetical protein